ncbi:MAG: hypothetical protein K2H60_09220, partial [Muribaculaceae bacterium]|nr:hypothetical protein [Muribaculaceae bacterium]
VRPALEIDAEEFIGVKSFKAKGKRISTFNIDSVVELEPLRFPPEPEPEPEPDDSIADEDPQEEDSNNPKVVQGDLFSLDTAGDDADSDN